MIEIIIDGQPTPWAAHKGYGRNSFNPRFKEKQYYQWQIKAQYNRESPLGCPVALHVVYHLPIPKQTSSIKRKQMLNGVLHHIKRPDTSNLTKFLEDCLKTIVFDDDSQVVELHCKKIYGEKPKTVIRIEPLS